MGKFAKRAGWPGVDLEVRWEVSGYGREFIESVAVVSFVCALGFRKLEKYL